MVYNARMRRPYAKDGAGNLKSAGALRIGFLTKLNEKEVNGETEDQRGDAYEQVILDTLNAGVPGLDLTFAVTRSFSRASFPLCHAPVLSSL